jgi:hypothetical protein
MTALIVGASLGVTGSLRLMTGPPGPSRVASIVRTESDSLIIPEFEMARVNIINTTQPRTTSQVRPF